MNHHTIEEWNDQKIYKCGAIVRWKDHYYIANGQYNQGHPDSYTDYIIYVFRSSMMLWVGIYVESIDYSTITVYY